MREFGRGSPSGGRVSLKACALPESFKGFAFHFKVRGDITAGRSHRGMTEIIANHRDINTPLKEGNTTGVATMSLET